MVSLMPMNVEVEMYSTVEFTCNYDYPDIFYIYFKLSPHDGFPLTARSGILGPIIKTKTGAYRTWSVHIGRIGCNVECHIVNYNGKELVKIMTLVIPGLTRLHNQRELSRILSVHIGDWRGKSVCDHFSVLSL